MKLKVLTSQNLRLLVCGNWNSNKPDLDFKRVSGGLLIQDRDIAMITENDFKVVTKRQPEKMIEDLLFSWKIAKMVKSMQLSTLKIYKQLE